MQVGGFLDQGFLREVAGIISVHRFLKEVQKRMCSMKPLLLQTEKRQGEA